MALLLVARALPLVPRMLLVAPNNTASNKKLLVTKGITRALLLAARMLPVAPGITASSKGTATRSKDATTSNRKLQYYY